MENNYKIGDFVICNYATGENCVAIVRSEPRDGIVDVEMYITTKKSNIIEPAFERVPLTSIRPYTAKWDK